jgi:ubiquinone biosynthesis monooxygenase Coq6
MLVWDRPAGGPRADGGAGRLALGAIRFDDADLDVGMDATGVGGAAPGAEHSALGYVVDNDTLRAAVFEQLRHIVDEKIADLSVQQTSVESVSYFDPQSFSSEQGRPVTGAEAAAPDHAAVPRWPIVQLANGEAFSARLIIAADGARSRIRTLAGFDWYLHSYDQTAVVANVALDRPITTAYQRFLSTGPVAVLPVASDATDDSLANVIWTTTPTEAAALSSASDVVFVDELNLALHDPDDDRAAFSKATGSAASRGLDHIIDLPVPTGQFPWSGSSGYSNSALPVPRATGVVGARARFPLSVGHAPRYVDPDRRTVLVGDAAHNIHPLAGQGVNLGFADARALAHALAVAAGTGRDVGGEDGAPLMRYERDRVAANVVMLGTMHTIHTLFAMNAWTPFNVARRVGVSALDSAGPVKKLILRAIS